MTDAELDRLAELIASALLRSPSADESATPRTSVQSWVPAPVRPEPSARVGEPPVWSGAAQSLDDVAPGPPTDRRGARVSTAELTNATRAAAAGRGAPPAAGPIGRLPVTSRPRQAGAPSIPVRVGVSRRHVHLSAAHVQALFAVSALTSARALSQPGQFAAAESLAVVGPKGRLEQVRVVGPTRPETQVELSPSDANALGIDPPVAASGSLAGSLGGVTLIGPAGRIELEHGVIVAARHLHLSPDDARRWGLRNGDRLDVRCGAGPRLTTFHDVLVRSGEGHATELHLDSDEANAASVNSGDLVEIVRWRASPGGGRRPLITERDVIRLAREGARLPADGMLTPSARDRARALRLLDA